MKAERYAQAKRIFLAACSLERGERTRFVAAECGQDADLHDQVRLLLSEDEACGDFMETPAAAAGDSPALGAGAQAGRFRIVRPIGEGGMGVVYEAEQDEPRRRVALKVIRAGLISRGLRSRFRHEVRILGRLRHPGIAQIYEAGAVTIGGESLPFFAMELVEGRPLPDCAREHGLGPRERLELVAQVCDAVHHAHVKGVVHRDLKPGNILVEEAPSTTGGGDTRPSLQVKILDFGVARAATPDDQPLTIQTHAGQIIGTLAYMSPEQAAGDPTGVDARSDVYSIGVIAYELLCGRLPCPVHAHALHEAARLIREVDPPRLGAIDRSLRGDAETIVGKALEKDPARRYQSAAEMGADIRRFLRDEPIMARPASALYQLGRFARRNKPLVAAAAVVFAAMVTATIVSTWQARVAERARLWAEAAQRRADLTAAEARHEAIRSTLAGAGAAIASGDPIVATRLLEGADEGSRGWAWRYWSARLDDCVALLRPGGKVTADWISGDGREVALLTAEGEVLRGSPWAGELPVVARVAPAAMAAFLDDGRRLITNGADRTVVTVFDGADGRLLAQHGPIEAAIGLLVPSADGSVVLAGPRRPGRSPADVLYLLRGNPEGGWAPTRAMLRTGTWSAAMTPDGRRVALGNGLTSLLTWDEDAPEPEEFGRMARGVQALAISDDGSQIAASGVDKVITLWDGRTREVRRVLAGHSGEVTALRFDRTGGLLASAGADLTIRLWETAGGGQLAAFIGHTGAVRSVRFGGDGALVMSTSEDGSVRLWRREPYEGTCILRGHSSYVYAVAFSPDGSRIYSGAWDGSVRAWDAADGRAAGETASGHGYVTALGVSPDGRRIVSGHKVELPQTATELVEWDAGTLRPEGVLSVEQGEIDDIAFSPDGARLYVSSQVVAEFDLTPTPPRRRALTDEARPGCLALSPDGRRMAVGQRDGSISLLELPSGALTRQLDGHAGLIRGVAFHPTRPLLASASDDGTARLWDLASGGVTTLHGHADKVYCVAFSPDGRVLATGSEDTTIVLWEIAESPGGGMVEELTRLRGHEVYVYSLAFSPDGTRLVSGSGDHTVRVWDTRPVHERWRAREASRQTGAERRTAPDAPQGTASTGNRRGPPQ